MDGYLECPTGDVGRHGTGGHSHTPPSLLDFQRAIKGIRSSTLRALLDLLMAWLNSGRTPWSPQYTTTCPLYGSRSLFRHSASPLTMPHTESSWSWPKYGRPAPADEALGRYHHRQNHCNVGPAWHPRPLSTRIPTSAGHGHGTPSWVVAQAMGWLMNRAARSGGYPTRPGGAYTRLLPTNPSHPTTWGSSLGCFSIRCVCSHQFWQAHGSAWSTGYPSGGTDPQCGAPPTGNWSPIMGWSHILGTEPTLLDPRSSFPQDPSAHTLPYGAMPPRTICLSAAALARWEVYMSYWRWQITESDVNKGCQIQTSYWPRIPKVAQELWKNDVEDFFKDDSVSHLKEELNREGILQVI